MVVGVVELAGVAGDVVFDESFEGGEVLVGD